MGGGFKDHFSGHATAYASARPDYPRELFRWLGGKAPARNRAWDCATGNGQAAVALADYFKAVIATDASARQIANAVPRDRIEYRVARAEAPGLKAGSADLVTVAQAAHWLDRERFYASARHVLRRGGLLAIWGYDLLQVDKALDAVLGSFYRDTVGAYWPPERRLVDEHYAGLKFPFDEIPPPRLAMMVRTWTLEQLLAYLRTWSAVQRYRQARGTDPVALVAPGLAEAWGGEHQREVRWPLFLRAGYTD